jgi:hypothetical protein
MVRAIPGRRRMVLAAALALALTPFLVERSADSVIEAKHALGRARLERDLNSTLIAVKGQMRRCDRPMIPRGLSWLKGAVAWQADLPLRKVRTRGTGAVSFVRSLSDDPGLRLSARDSVTVVPHTVRFLLVVPFGDARIRIAHHPRLRLQTAAAAGQWRALVPASTPGCSVR